MLLPPGENDGKKIDSALVQVCAFWVPF